MIYEPHARKSLFRGDTNTWRLLIERGLVIASIWPACIALPDDTMVVCRIHQTWYGIQSSLVCQIRPLQNYTPLPFTQPFIVGVVHIQNRLVAVLNLGMPEHFAHSEYHLDTLLLIVTLHDMEVGLLTDEVIAAPHILWQS